MTKFHPPESLSNGSSSQNELSALGSFGISGIVFIVPIEMTINDPQSSQLERELPHMSLGKGIRAVKW